MENDNSMKFVNFEDFCSECKHKALDSVKDPCNECLEMGALECTCVPINFEKEEK